jgi:hypothetical protein
MRMMEMKHLKINEEEIKRKQSFHQKRKSN